MLEYKGQSDKSDLSKLQAKYRYIREEVRELRAENDALQRDLESLRANLSAAENQVNVIRNSLTFRVGVLVVNSRTLRGLIRLPWRLLRIFLEYRRRHGSPVQSLSEESDQAVLPQVIETRADYDQIWVGSDNSSETRMLTEFQRVDGNSYSAAFDNFTDCQTLEFSLPLEEEVLRFVSSSNIVISVKECSATAETFSQDFHSPVSGYDSAYAFVNEEPWALQFVYKCKSEKPFKVIVDIFIEESRGYINNGNSLPSLRCRPLSPGVSVIVPSYKGSSTITRCLDSLLKQSLRGDEYEVLVVLNGPDDGSASLLQDYTLEHPELDLKVLKAEFPSAGNARNLGLEAASREYLTFVDDDDFVSESYLSELLAASAPDKIAIASVLDVDSSGNYQDNIINQQLKNAQSYSKCHYKDVSSVLTMNACKMLPTFLASQIKYDSSMRSGEDVCYFTRYLTRFSPKLNLQPVKMGAVYYRFLSEQSVSRRPQSFEFNVKERVAVIQSLDRCIPFVTDKDKHNFLCSKIMAQSGFIRTYLEKNRGEIGHYASLLQGTPIHFSYDKQIAAALSDTLVYSYCFAPYVDTAGIVMAKRIQALGAPVDVVCNSMEGVRKFDQRLNRITAGLVGRTISLNGRPSFSSWPEIKRFAVTSQKTVTQIEKDRGTYQVIYSRAMWVASHFAAVMHKLRCPDVFWRAEFSDPILKDVHGADRVSELERSWLRSSGILAALRLRKIEIPESTNLFFWCEFLVYVFADEIVFTNENQFTYMMSYAGLPSDLQESISDKSVVRHHPSLPQSFYGISDPDYPLDDDAVNLAYFGSFYPTRGLGEVFLALCKMTPEESRRIRIHVFTSNVDEVNNECVSLGVSAKVVVNPYVSYIDFLSLSNRFDCLIVNDAVTKSVKFINPYLPSKLSDYLGSSSNIWAIFEEGSILHDITIKNESERLLASSTGDQCGHVNILRILSERKTDNAT